MVANNRLLTVERGGRISFLQVVTVMILTCC
jgi:hypothetical protein